jgi:hypothetical protein
MPDFVLREPSLRDFGLRAMGRCPVAASGGTCLTCLKAGADRHLVKKAPPDLKPLPIQALNISVNPHYPLLSTVQHPQPFVRPADVMPPTAMEAEFGLASGSNLPVVTTKSLSAPVVLKNGTHQLPSRISIGLLLQSPVSPVAGTMGPPPRPVKK